MNLRRIMLLLFLIYGTTLSAQVVIKDLKTKEPIPFVHIFDSQGFLGAVSDINGKITPEDIQLLTLSPETMLNIQHIAYETKEIISSRLTDSKEIYLAERAVPLNEVVITPQTEGYDYIRLQTYFRSYVLQNNEPLYYVDGIASYYIPRQKGKTGITLDQHRVFHNKQLDAKNKLNSFFVSISNKPGLADQIDILNELSRKYHFQDSETGQQIVIKDSVAGHLYHTPETKLTTVYLDRIAPDSAKSFKLGSLRIEKNRWYGSTQYVSFSPDEKLDASDIQSAKEFYSTIFTNNKKGMTVEIETLKEVYLLDKSFFNKDEIPKKEFVKPHQIPTISEYQTEYWNTLNQRNIPPIDPNFEKRLGELLIMEK